MSSFVVGVSAPQEKGIIRGYLIELFGRTHSEDLIPLEPLRPVVNQELYDSNAKEDKIQVREKVLACPLSTFS